MTSLRRDLSTILTGSDWGRLGFLVVILVINSAIELLALMAVPLFIAVLMEGAGAGSAHGGTGYDLLRDLCTHLGFTSVWGTAVAAGALLLALNLLRLIWAGGGIYLQWRILANRRIALSSRLLRDYLSTPSAFRLKRNRPDLVNRCVNECERVINDFIGNALAFVQHSVILLAIIGLLFYYMPLITVTALASMGVFAGSYLVIRRKQLRHLSEENFQGRSNAQINANEALATAEATLLAGTRSYFIDLFHHSVESAANAYRKNAMHIQLIWPYLEFVSLFTLLGVTYMAFRLTHGDINAVATQISLLAVALVRLRTSAINLLANITQLRFNRASLSAVADDLRESEFAYQCSVDRLHKREDIASNDQEPALLKPFSLELKDIYFHYDSHSTDYLLRDFNLKIGAGESVGIAGPTGCGKSTVLRLLAGLESPQFGGIKIDSDVLFYRKRAIRDPYAYNARIFEELLFMWRHAVGYVPQKIALIDDTIAANIALGWPKEIRERPDVAADIAWAASQAQLDDFIASLPAGLNTHVGENGVCISGGQMQRIGIARAFFQHPQMLLFDEATSALDNETESAICQTLQSIKGKITTVTVAHRLSTLKHCDRILFMQEGKIIADAPFAQLYEQCTPFRAMCDAGELI